MKRRDFLKAMLAAAAAPAYVRYGSLMVPAVVVREPRPVLMVEELVRLKSMLEDAAVRGPFTLYIHQNNLDALLWGERVKESILESSYFTQLTGVRFLEHG